MRELFATAVFFVFGIAWIAAQLLPPTGLKLVDAPVKNVPLEISLPVSSPEFVTNLNFVIGHTSTITNAAGIWDTNIATTITQRLPLPLVTNYLITLFTGTNRSAAETATNLLSIITNRGPVRFSVSPTNRYVVTLWGLTASKERFFVAQGEFPSAPSNVVRFVIAPLFSDDLALPESQWTLDTNIYVLAVTNPAPGKKFMRARAAVVNDDFTPKAVNFSNAFHLFPTNTP